MFAEKPIVWGRVVLTRVRSNLNLILKKDETQVLSELKKFKVLGSAVKIRFQILGGENPIFGHFRGL